jgi:hypothetical protein
MKDLEARTPFFGVQRLNWTLDKKILAEAARGNF